MYEIVSDVFSCYFYLDFVNGIYAWFGHSYIDPEARRS
jgi:hypothetical protein